jgi:HPt (histidine-containing phosphotransfer) domain-containing protein
MDRSLFERFVPRLIEVGSERVARAREILSAGLPEGAEELESSFHRLAGEAGIVGLPAISELAREVEVLAAAAISNPASRAACEHSLDDLERALAALKTSAMR